MMQDDDPVCLCFNVSKRKIVNFIKRDRPSRASLISECLSAGTGCGWCVPFITKLHEQIMAGESNPDIALSPDEYAKQRGEYRHSRKSELPGPEGR